MHDPSSARKELEISAGHFVRPAARARHTVEYLLPYEASLPPKDGSSPAPPAKIESADPAVSGIWTLHRIGGASFVAWPIRSLRAPNESR